MKRASFLQKPYIIYIATAIGSLILTGINLAHNQPFNVDGIMYLKAAEEFLRHGFNASFVAYKWPFYSILIALTAKITTLSLISAAHLLNAFLYVLIATAFIALIKELGGDRKTQWFGVFVILFFPYLAKFGADIMRDHGYFAFSLLAFIGLIKYARTRHWFFALLWGMAILIATLFRIEGAVLLCLLPLALLFIPRMNFWSKVSLWLCSNLVLIVGLFLVFLWSIFQPKSLHAGRVPELLFQLQYGFQSVYHALLAKLAIINGQIFSTTAPYRGGAFLFLMGGLAAFYFGCLIAALGVLYFFLCFFSIRYKFIPYDSSAKAVWIGGIIVNLIVTMLFLLQDYFLTTRYVGLLGLLLLLAVPFWLANFRKNFLIKIFVFLWMLAIAAGTMVSFGPSKEYVVDAGIWVVSNVPSDSKVYCNDRQMFYYTQHQGLLDDSLTQLDKKKLQHFDYAVIKIKRHCQPKECALLDFFKKAPLQEFQNKSGDRILIYKLK